MSSLWPGSQDSQESPAIQVEEVAIVSPGENVLQERKLNQDASRPVFSEPAASPKRNTQPSTNCSNGTENHVVQLPVVDSHNSYDADDDNDIASKFQSQPTTPMTQPHLQQQQHQSDMKMDIDDRLPLHPPSMPSTSAEQRRLENFMSDEEFNSIVTRYEKHKKEVHDRLNATTEANEQMEKTLQATEEAVENHKIRKESLQYEQAKLRHDLLFTICAEGCVKLESAAAEYDLFVRVADKIQEIKNRQERPDPVLAIDAASEDRIEEFSSEEHEEKASASPSSCSEHGEDTNDSMEVHCSIGPDHDASEEVQEEVASAQNGTSGVSDEPVIGSDQEPSQTHSKPREIQAESAMDASPDYIRTPPLDTNAEMSPHHWLANERRDAAPRIQDPNSDSKSN